MNAVRPPEPALGRRLAIWPALLALLALIAFPSGAGAAGAPTAVSPIGSSIQGVAAESGGSVIAVGSNADGMLVQRISAAGAPGAAFAAGTGVGSAVTIQPDGKIVVAGTDGGMVVRRFNTDGSLDTGFGTGGTTHLPGTTGRAVALGPGGTIVVAGTVIAGDTYSRVALGRLTSAGAPDPSFGGGGFVVVDIGRGSKAKGVVVQSDGRIVFVGEQIPGLQVVNSLIARVLPSGALDPSFSGGGVYFHYGHNGGANTSFNAVTIDSAGRVVAAGGESQETGPFALFARLTPCGTPDTSFGTAGLLHTPASINFYFGEPLGAAGVAIAGGGEIVAAGAYQDSGLRYAALWAITPAGQLDGSVDSDGRVELLPSPTGGESRAVTVTPDGSLFAGGETRDYVGPTGGFVARYTGFGPPPARGSSTCGTTPPRTPGQAAPTVQTDRARRITDTSAILAGAVNPKGAAATYRFQYGKTTAYGATTSMRSVAAGSATVPASILVSRLRQRTTYHYRLVASGPGGTTVGADRTLRTGKTLGVTLSRLAFRYRIASILRSGLRLSVRTNQAARIDASLLVDRSTARRIGFGRKLTLAKSSKRLRRAGRALLRLKPVGAARRALARQRRSIVVTVRVITTATATGKRRTVNRRTTLRP